MTYVLFLLGLVGLFLGGEVLIRGAVGVARRFHVPPLIIGLTIVGFGTSTPELLVGLQAALAGAPALAIGNVIGSNIANILLILGSSALIAAVPLPLPTMRRDFAVMIGATLVLWLMLAGGTVTRTEGLFLVAALGAYLWLCLRNAAGSEPPATEEPPRPVWQSVAMALGGLVILMIGARLLVDSSTEIARAFGVSEAVIGLTIVAIGTSLPELATAIIAALRGHSEIAVGNILGSNVFNIFGILGVTATVTPIPVEPRFVGLDMALALAAALAMLGFAALPGRVGRAGGVALLAAYAGYIGLMSAG
ncbi:calcium/sodium antiporter [Defluviimonas aestuarii]|uniref:calcium/sodium antiporter n=1 Tax=Albidovulum aestuarii TaxID=1130726 RepID=UPI00249A657E|nr:calcium/sodium antiporter [Defluviimonas aestuarii]MDI3335833.1 calcium/sodium antiporter [Defluviimonas aestuarii]